MKTLLDGKHDPITHSWGFLQACFGEVSAAFDAWQRSWGHRIERFSCDLDTALARLIPMRIGCRHLIMSTLSHWTAIFIAHPSGPQAAIPYLVKTCGYEGLLVVCVEDTYECKSNTGRYGSVQFQLYSPDSRDFTKTARALSATNDGGKWKFYDYGQRLPFEKPKHYAARRIRDRFTDELLEEYCAALGIRLFEPDFYGPECALFIPESEFAK